MSAAHETPDGKARQLDDSTAGTITLGDLTVRRLGFGAMRISGARNADGKRDRDEAIRLTRRAVERGINFLDTANIYGYGESEDIIAEALHPYPEGLVIATKAGYLPGKILAGHASLPPQGDPALIKAECEKSLRRLRVDAIDILQVHTPDPMVPFADTVGAFAALQQEGKVRHIGLCNVSSAQLALAREMCEVVSVQNRYNTADRISEKLLDECASTGIAFLPWQPSDLRSSAAKRTVEEIAAERNLPSQQVSIAWLLKRSDAMLPIPGTSNVNHLDINTDAAWVTLSQDEYDRIDRAAAL
jgi:pyridoxine 4-dehydrogenase